MLTLLFTDIEGSTRLWEAEGARMSAALARHDAIARDVVARHRGVIVKIERDMRVVARESALSVVDPGQPLRG